MRNTEGERSRCPALLGPIQRRPGTATDSRGHQSALSLRTESSRQRPRRAGLPDKAIARYAPAVPTPVAPKRPKYRMRVGTASARKAMVKVGGSHGAGRRGEDRPDEVRVESDAVGRHPHVRARREAGRRKLIEASIFDCGNHPRRQPGHLGDRLPRQPVRSPLGLPDRGIHACAIG
jgi:hypothetical protein